MENTSDAMSSPAQTSPSSQHPPSPPATDKAHKKKPPMLSQENRLEPRDIWGSFARGLVIFKPKRTWGAELKGKGKAIEKEGKSEKEAHGK
ncbi:hypothetical protein LZ554_008527 [Drepanopeziza brunnea f. sp. 'monogermtubi']|nr:hypothetical protein LZ554_008527 [Drepanopeziza brunnea f. sp. 'monogermtubi']